MFFSDYFSVDVSTVENYGAFDISLVSDLPLFVDPFLLFNSQRDEYQALHQNMIHYLRFLRDISSSSTLSDPLVAHWFEFSEVKQTWLGFTVAGNRGSGLGTKFAHALANNLHQVFRDFGEERITRGSHLEKLCLIRSGVGRDNISDFCTNLIKQYLLEFTQEFTTTYISRTDRGSFSVRKVAFDKATRTWRSGTYTLPRFENDYVILTPKDILTRDETWISRSDMIHRYESIAEALPNAELRALLNDYLLRMLPRNPSPRQQADAVAATIAHHPEFIDHYIRHKEDDGASATSVSKERVEFTRKEFGEHVAELSRLFREEIHDPPGPAGSYDEAMERVLYMKHVIEDNDGYRLFYVNGEPVGTEHDLQLLFRLTWTKTIFDVNSEVNNGRGPVDYKVSYGFADKTLVEFKLARNTKLKQNLQRQVEIYQLANQTKRSIKVILYFFESELDRVKSILFDLDLLDEKSIVLIDARIDNKPSASTAQ